VNGNRHQQMFEGSTWFRGAAARLLRSPALYDLVQLVAGERQFRRHLLRHLGTLPVGCRLVDIGGGTGLRPQGSTIDTYVCMDVDFAKLRRFRGGRSGRLAVVGDAIASPFPANTFDAVLCAKVVHHLNDGALNAMLAESLRILKSGGVLILVDAVRTADWTSRLLWRVDRGSCPRTAAEIRGALPTQYAVGAYEEFRIAPFHRFAVYAARKTCGRESRPGGVAGG
jgi:SAM-dependent methyltransferase